MSEHPIVQLARKTIETYIKEKKIIVPPGELTPEMKEKAGVFVSLHRHGDLRGCIGTFAPTAENVAQEIIRNAIESSTRDPRFPPMTGEELTDLEISVDVLSEPEAVKAISELDAKEYGVIVKAGRRKGLLLPDLEGVNTPEEQIAICRRKAGIGENEAVELFRFRVKRYH
ncbi:AmmeMemoRadiSam system protein A [Candidatus Saganbacteria bacterium]|uniref:AmmeMemoRadiSam system protein A n=1 Tax=Candidatus Saganbacteria bacterium TaxID=2575572 RepID=A0A9D6UN29_UNCSA|nr:AmmeMemoRadiSam system protein A [Candidatus Saganbacteria bacterium]